MTKTLMMNSQQKPTTNQECSSTPLEPCAHFPFRLCSHGAQWQICCLGIQHHGYIQLALCGFPWTIVFVRFWWGRFWNSRIYISNFVRNTVNSSTLCRAFWLIPSGMQHISSTFGGSWGHPQIFPTSTWVHPSHLNGGLHKQRTPKLCISWPGGRGRHSPTRQHFASVKQAPQIELWIRPFESELRTNLHVGVHLVPLISLDALTTPSSFLLLPWGGSQGR